MNPTQHWNELPTSTEPAYAPQSGQFRPQVLEKSTMPEAA